MAETLPFCLECNDTGYLGAVEFGQAPTPCPHCDTGAAAAVAEARDMAGVD